MNKTRPKPKLCSDCAKSEEKLASDCYRAEQKALKEGKTDFKCACPKVVCEHLAR